MAKDRNIWIGTDTGNEGEWGTAANWSLTDVPDGDNDEEVYLTNSSQSVTADFDQSDIVLTTLHIEQSFTGRIDDYLNIGVAAVNIGQHGGPGLPVGSGRILLNTHDDVDTVTKITVYNTAAAAYSADGNVPPVRLITGQATDTLEVRKGKVGLAYGAAETATIGTVTVSHTTQPTTDSEVWIGVGTTITNVNVYAGKCHLNCAATTITVTGGVLYIEGSGAIGTINQSGGTVYSNTTGTITAVNITGGTLDTTRSAAARTIITLKVDNPGVFKYDPAVVTLTNKIQPVKTSGAITYTAS